MTTTEVKVIYSVDFDLNIFPGHIHICTQTHWFVTFIQLAAYFLVTSSSVPNFFISWKGELGNMGHHYH